ncbi:permease [Porphyromonas gingivalis W50]|nr:permease [Porphyromonas gingivalis W50]
MNNKTLQQIGEYTKLMQRTFSLPNRWRMSFRELIKEIDKLGVDSVWIVIIISFFIGAVITIQLSLNMTSPLIPRFTIGYSTREIILLEFSSTVMCLILAGKVGSSIASELGTMRVTEQIDAMEVMGVNSANYLILPKIIGFMLFVPVLSIISMSTGIVGGYLACSLVPNLPRSDFEYGLQLFFSPYNVVLLHYQVGGLCFHHIERGRLLRLYGERWGIAGGESKYQRCGSVQYIGACGGFTPHEFIACVNVILTYYDRSQRSQ